jgi:hypothetical protein
VLLALQNILLSHPRCKLCIPSGVRRACAHPCARQLTNVANPILHTSLFTPTRTDIKKGGWTTAEELQLCQWHSILGPQWSKISKKLPGALGCAAYAVQARVAHADVRVYACVDFHVGCIPSWSRSAPKPWAGRRSITGTQARTARACKPVRAHGRRAPAPASGRFPPQNDPQRPGRTENATKNRWNGVFRSKASVHPHLQCCGVLQRGRYCTIRAHTGAKC